MAPTTEVSSNDRIWPPLTQQVDSTKSLLSIVLEDPRWGGNTLSSREPRPNFVPR